MMKHASLILLASLGACSDTCVNTEVSRLTAPNGRFDAVLFQRDCGATTGFSSQIAIVLRGGVLGVANAFYRADDDHGAARAGPWGGPAVTTHWLAADRLLVRYAEKSRIFEQGAKTSGVSITYQVDAR